jgi:hypothetical protein
VNINRELLKETTPYLDKYNCFQRELRSFLLYNKDFERRQRKALRIIWSIMIQHRKEKLFDYVVELARVEPKIRELQPWARDHVVHALLSFVLGIYINEKFFPIKTSTKVNPFQWKIAGLFHDVGYPVQIAKDAILKPFTNRINDIKSALHTDAPDINFTIVPAGLENLRNGVNAIDLIQARLKDWNLSIDAKKEYEKMVSSGNICHGIISSLAVLYVVDLLYQKYNPRRVHKNIYSRTRRVNFNQKYFEKDVVSACAAIYIHNLPDRCFAKAKIDRSNAPVAFLLKLADSLQEWERPSLNDQKGFPAQHFAINVKQGTLIFEANISPERKEKIRKDLVSTLIATDIKIL